MTKRYNVRHVTEYRYARPMSDGFTMAHLMVRPTGHQRVDSSVLTVDPQPDEWEDTLDVFGNRVTLLAMHRPHDHLVVEAVSEVVTDASPIIESGPPWEDAAAQAAESRGDLAIEVGPYTARSRLAPSLPELSQLTDQVFTPNRPLVDAVRHLCNLIFTDFTFDPGFTDVTTPLGSVLAARRGVCQDFAHIGVAALRSVGLAARYVSGYIETLPAPGEPKLVGVDASHAWCSVWVPRLGWLDFDPTNDHLPPMDHVTVGWGRDYGDVAPVRGVVIGVSGGQQLRVAVDVTRLE